MTSKKHGKNKKRVADNPPSSWPVAYRWVAMGTLVVYTAVGAKTVTLAHAQESGQGIDSSRQAQGSLPVYRFDIQAGALTGVLEAFRRVTGLTATLAAEEIGRVSSPGVVGLYTPERALEKLLAGTGIAYRLTGAENVRLELQSIAASIVVTDSMPELGNSLPKYTSPILDTPQTIHEVSRQTMEEQGTTTLRDALRNVAGISLAAGEGGAQGDSLTIRGFTARNDLFIDGMRDFGSYYRDPFNTQEVEVLEGPSSVTFGRGSTGGVVNQAGKTPHLDKSISVEADLGTDLTRRVTFDLNQPLNKLGTGAAFRLNLMGDEGSVAGREVAKNRRFGVAPSLAFGLGTATRWTFSYMHQSADDTPDYGLPWLFNGPAPVNRENYYGFKNGNYLRTGDDIGTARVEHDFNEHVTLRDQVRYANYVREALITEAQIATPTTVNRHEIGVNSVESFLDEQLDLTATFHSGFLAHKLVSGIEAGRETSDPTRPTWTNVPSTSLADPDPDQMLSGVAAITSRVRTIAVSTAAYVLDTVSFGQRWDLTGGIRWDRFDTDYRQTVEPVSAFHRVDEMPSWRAALVFKPAPAGSIYFDAGTSFNPSAESLSLSASNSSLPPERNKTYELGSKWDASGGRLSLRGSLFRTEKSNAREPDPANALLNVLAGNQRVDGVQLELKGHLTNRWELLAGYAWLDGKVISSNYYPLSVGAQLANAPRNTLSFWSTYRLPGHWQAGFGGNYVGSRTASSTAPFDPTTGLLKEAPGYWVFNAMAKHPLSEHVDLQVNASNIANRYYYDQIHPAHIVPGPGRSALIGLRFKF